MKLEIVVSSEKSREFKIPNLENKNQRKIAFFQTKENLLAKCKMKQSEE